MEYNQDNRLTQHDPGGTGQSGGYQAGWPGPPHMGQPYQYGTPSQSGGTPAGYQPVQPVAYQPAVYQSAPPQPEVEVPVEPRKNRGGFRQIAALIAVAMISGAVGGGATYARLADKASSEPQMSAVGESTSQADRPNVSGVAVAPTSITGVVNKASDSVVEISVQTMAGNPFLGRFVTEGGGSGVVISEDGYIVTNDHVIENAQSITVRTRDGDEHDARLIGTDSKTDLAVIKIEAAGLKPVSYADSSRIQVGEIAVAIGNPLGTLGGTVTDGIISAKDREITISGETMTLLQTSAAVNPGNSGGGLFNADGDLVGVINAKSAGVDVEGLGFAIPSNLVQQVAQELIRNGYVSGRPQLGITVQEIPDVRTAWMYGVEEPGFYVRSAAESSPLQVNDRIISIDGQDISTFSDIKKVIEQKQVGDVVEMVVGRGGKRVTVQVTLLEQTPISSEVPEVKESDL